MAMGWITSKKRQPGWLALLLHHDQVDLVHVKRGANGRPAVLMCDSYRKEESDAATLTRLARELKLDRYRVTTLAFYQEDGLLTFTRGGELYNSRRIDISLPQLLQADDARRTVYFERI